MMSKCPGWLSRIETLGTTVIVLMVGGMMVWYEAVVVHEWRLSVVIGSVALLCPTLDHPGTADRRAYRHSDWDSPLDRVTNMDSSRG
jgi:hypothetical protein